MDAYKGTYKGTYKGAYTDRYKDLGPGRILPGTCVVTRIRAGIRAHIRAI